MAHQDLRIAALRRFALAITTLNVIGHLWLGFEQSYAQPLVAIITAYFTEILLEVFEARCMARRPRFLGGRAAVVDFLLSPHISGLAVSMLLYANDRLLPIAFAAATAIGSKYLFRIIINGRNRHFLNPSNFGITVTLLLFPWVGIAQPYMFTENLHDFGRWFFPIFVTCLGTLLNAKFTLRIPLILAWLAGFVLQAAIRHFLFGNLFLASLNPMTGIAFLLFTFYMVTDPATTPSSMRGQIAFGVSVAAAYGFLMSFHVVFGLFFGLTAVCIGRGLMLFVANWAVYREQVRNQLTARAVG